MWWMLDETSFADIPVDPDSASCEKHYVSLRPNETKISSLRVMKNELVWTDAFASGINILLLSKNKIIRNTLIVVQAINMSAS